ncbi:T9SS type A sorting domain-containing protein [Neolewinella sp.]|uniref:T9SS type A sorting domain-containing protein n=1 Tax=Neolewinella sp. TaxID=2993543 RepID=UPI003B527828
MLPTILLLLISSCALIGQTQLGQDIDGEAADDRFGTSVSLSAGGQRLAIGATSNDGTGPNAGHVRIYDLTPSGDWQQIGQDIDGEAAEDQSGFSVALSADGQRVAIGAPATNTTGRGQVRIYRLNESTLWQQLGQDIDGENLVDQSGTSVSLSADGQRVAIGAPRNRGRSAFASGHVRIYEFKASGNWQQIGQDLDGEAAEDRSGTSVSLSADGQRVAIGARFNDGNGSNAGQVRVYGLNPSGTWQQLGQDIDGEAAEDQSGISVSLSADGQRVAIGALLARGASIRAGHVRIYEFKASGNWQQLGQDLDGEATDDRFGTSVSLSTDGLGVAIGAPDFSGASAGYTRIYNLNAAGDWQQLGQDIDGEAAGDQSGFSVSLSAEGLRVAIGAPTNDGSGSNAGQVRVYALEAVTLPIELLSFTATSRAGTHALAWTTTVETNNDYFTVEHATDEQDWYEVATITGAGTSTAPLTYVYVHTAPSTGANYYRLRQTDFDGTSSTSNIIVMVHEEEATASLRVYPNPVTNGWLTVLMPETYRTSRIELLSSDGRVVAIYHKDDTLIQLLGLPMGLYTLRVSGELEVLHTAVVVGASW